MAVHGSTVDLLKRFCSPEVLGATGLATKDSGAIATMAEIGELYRQGLLTISPCAVNGLGQGGEVLISTTSIGRDLIDSAMIG